MGSQLKAGVIGAGIMGERHAQTFKANPNAALVAIADLDQKRAEEVAQNQGCAAYRSAEELLEGEDLDVVFIATPDPYHLAPLLTVLAAGMKKIVIEKPFATTVQDAERMYQAAEDAGATVFVAFGTRSAPENAASRYMLSGDLTGEPLFASLRNVDNVSVPRQMWANRPDNWASKSSSVHFLHSHRIDRLRWLYRPAEVESVVAFSRSKLLGYSTDFTESVLTWTNGMVTRIHTGWMAFGNRLVYGDGLYQGTAAMITHNEGPAFGRPLAGWQIVFDEIDMATLQRAQNELRERGISTRLVWEEPGVPGIPKLVPALELVPGNEKDRKGILDYVIDAIVEDTLCPTSWKTFQGDAPLPTSADGLEQTRVCFAVEDAAKTEQKITLRS